MNRRSYLFPCFKSPTGTRYGRQFCHIFYRPLTIAQQRSLVSNCTQNSRVSFAPTKSGESIDKEVTSQPHIPQQDMEGTLGSGGESTASSAGSSAEGGLCFQKWLALESELRGRCVAYSKNCILSPFLFGKKMNYCDKILSWLAKGDLLPKPRHICGSLSDRNIEISDCTEDAADIILSSMNSIDFLGDVCQVTEQLKECNSVEEALSIAAKSNLVSLISQCFLTTSGLTEKDFQLITITVLYQAMKHVEQANSSVGDHMGAFEDALKAKEDVCSGLRLRGNRHFKDKEYKTAIMFYTRAIKLSPFNHILYGNRAQSYHNLQQYREALSDAKRAVFLKPNWEKGHYRYAQACHELGFTEKAIALNLKAQKTCSKREVLLKQVQLFRHGNSDATLSHHKRKRTASSSSTSEDGQSCEGASSVSLPSLMSSESDGDNDDDDDDDDENSMTREGVDHLHFCDLPFLASDSDSDDDEDSVDVDFRSVFEDMPPLEECDSFDDSLSDLDDSMDGSEDESAHATDEESQDEDDEDFPSNLPFEILPNPFEVLMHSRSLLEMIQEFLQAHPEMTSEDVPSAALPEVIESLPKITVTQAQIDENHSCAICRCDYELKEEVLRLPCEHIFHSPCVTTWLKMHATCPTCRDVLPH